MGQEFEYDTKRRHTKATFEEAGAHCGLSRRWTVRRLLAEVTNVDGDLKGVS
jgi:hypothetical protein